MYPKKLEQRADGEKCISCHGTGVIVVSNPVRTAADQNSRRFVLDVEEQGALLWGSAKRYGARDRVASRWSVAIRD
jgi:hypothetical protein